MVVLKISNNLWNFLFIKPPIRKVFMSLSTVFKSYRDDEQATLNGSVQWKLNSDSNQEPCDSKSGALFARLP